MKRILSVILAILLLIGAVLFLVWVLYKTDIIKSKEKEPEVLVQVDKFGKKFTKKIWSFMPKETRKILVENDYADITVSIPLRLQNNSYYYIRIPKNVPYVVDYDKSVYGQNGEYSILVANNVFKSNIAKKANIENPVNLSSNTFCSQSGKRGSKVIVKFFEDYNMAIICTVYNNSDVWNCLRKFLISNDEIVVRLNPSYADYLDKIEKLKYTGEYSQQVIFKDTEIKAEQFLFENGYLYMQYELKPIEELKDIYSIRLNIISGEIIKASYIKQGIIFIKTDNYSVGLFAYNNNSTVALFGKGEEAECNIIGILSGLE